MTSTNDNKAITAAGPNTTTLGWFKCSPCCCCNLQENESPSNETLLSTAFLSFLLFAIVQFFASLWAESEAMMADTAAMAVDTCTYAFNLVTERLKTRYSPKQRLQLEFVTPFFSVLVLAAVNVYFIRRAAQTLIQHPYVNPSDEPKPKIMLTFSILNLCLDAVNVTCFARAKKLLGFEIGSDGPDLCGAHHHQTMEESYSVEENDPSVYESEKMSVEETTDHYEELNNSFAVKDDDSVNLNMCSAYTHVFADTLRSIAVILAACIAEFVKGVESNQADAIATLIVSFLIFLSLFPLLKGLFYTALKLREEMLQAETAELELINNSQYIT